MSIRELIKNPPANRETTVEHDGKSYRVKGGSAINALGRSLFVTPNEFAVKAKHWTLMLNLEEPFDPSMVKHVLVVASTLQHEEGEEPYDELEIVRLALAEPGLFVALMAAGYEVLGVVPGAEDGAFMEVTEGASAALEEMVAGNSPKPAGSKSKSTAGSSKRQESPDKDS
jgi:hypothetical protein